MLRRLLERVSEAGVDRRPQAFVASLGPTLRHTRNAACHVGRLTGYLRDIADDVEVALEDAGHLSDRRLKDPISSEAKSLVAAGAVRSHLPMMP